MDISKLPTLLEGQESDKDTLLKDTLLKDTLLNKDMSQEDQELELQASDNT